MLKLLSITLIVAIVSIMISTLPLQIQASTTGSTLQQGRVLTDSDPAVQPDQGTPPETTGGENEDIGSMLSAVPTDQRIPPGECPEGFTPATPPLNPQLGCVPESATADPGVQPGEDEGIVQDESSGDETSDGENEDIGSTISGVPTDQESVGEDEEGE
jgi:hypothetical protein